MLKIKKGTVILEVLEGAFYSIYSKQGFKIIEGKKEEPAIEKVEVKVIPKHVELLEKPLSQWTKAECVEYAKNMELDYEGKSVAELKVAIKEDIERIAQEDAEEDVEEEEKDEDWD